MALAVDEVPAELEVTARTDTGVIMGLRHRGLPVEGTTELSGARELVGADAATPIIQQTGLSVTWRSR